MNEPRLDIEIQNVVMFRILCRIESKLTDRPYDELVEQTKQEIADLRAFFQLEPTIAKEQ